MEVKWVPWKSALGMVKAAGICPHNAETSALVEWGAAGVVQARARLAIVNGEAKADYPIPERLWKVLEDGRGGVDRSSGEIRCELPGVSFQHRSTKVVAQGVEFLADRLFQLLPDVIELPSKPAKRLHPSSLQEQDAPLLEEMRALIEGGKVSGPNPAALQVVDRAAGGGNLDSKVRRLERRYQETFGA
jgi:hypothetical protein